MSLFDSIFWSTDTPKHNPTLLPAKTSIQSLYLLQTWVHWDRYFGFRHHCMLIRGNNFMAQYSEQSK